MKATIGIWMLVAAGMLASGSRVMAQAMAPEDEWITATGQAAGTDANARDEALKAALRKAVEQGTGVFLTAQSKTEDYKATYDKIFANTVGYVKRQKEPKFTVEGNVTTARVQVLVSTQKFEEEWANIAHTVHQENNPRVIIAVAEATLYNANGPVYNVDEAGIVQGKVEDFFLSRNITLTDRETAGSVNKRDLLLASIKDDEKEMAAFGTRFKADVLVLGRATAKFSREVDVEGQKMYMYTATLNIRVIQADSARVLASKSYGPVTATVLQKAGGEDKALSKLAQDSAPDLLGAVVEAWRKRANVGRSVSLSISGMDYAAWKQFRDEASNITGMQAIRLREITEGVANIDMETKFSNENLADRLCELKAVPVSVQEITANRLKLKVKAVAATEAPKEPYREPMRKETPAAPAPMSQP